MYFPHYMLLTINAAVCDTIFHGPELLFRNVIFWFIDTASDVSTKCLVFGLLTLQHESAV